MSDSLLSAFGFSTPDMDEVFSPASIVAGMFRFEIALAQALADVGLIDGAAAAAIVAACETPLPEPSALLATTWEKGTPVIDLVAAIRDRLPDEVDRRTVHFGATTQDVVDTTYMTLSKEALGILANDMVEIADSMRHLAEEHRQQPHMARSFLQHAGPTTFGLSVAVSWLNPVLDRILALRSIASSLPAQLGGPIGELSTYGSASAKVVQGLADRLQLTAPATPWHTDRAIVRDLAHVVESTVSTLAKTATDVALLAQTDIGEVSVRSGESSSIPGKRNPIDAVRILAAADLCHGVASSITGSRPHELARALGSWHVEWAAIPLLFMSAGAVTEAAARMVSSLEVNTDAMTSNTSAEPNRDTMLVDSILARYNGVVG